jgi:hypothetical protein
MMYRDDGYSLLELLVAVAPMALLAFPLTESVRTGLSVWSVAHSDADSIDRVNMARGRLRNWLENAYPAYYSRLEELTYPMSGASNTLSFIAPLNPDDRVNDMHQVSLQLDDSGAVIAAVKSDVLHNGDWCLDAMQDCITAPLVTGVSSLEFSYLDPVSGDWVGAWPAVNTGGHELQKELPKAVIVRLSFDDPRYQWPDLTVPLQVSEWSRCQLNQTNNQCGRD